jgi:hypothetical protein
LNSGGIIGYVTDIYDMIADSNLEDDDDDQLFYTKIFLNKPTRVIFIFLNSLLIQDFNGNL